MTHKFKLIKDEAKSCASITSYCVEFRGIELGDVIVDPSFGLTMEDAEIEALNLVAHALASLPDVFEARV